jgi:hypothetical protein
VITDWKELKGDLDLQSDAGLLAFSQILLTALIQEAGGTLVITPRPLREVIEKAKLAEDMQNNAKMFEFLYGEDGSLTLRFTDEFQT